MNPYRKKTGSKVSRSASVRHEQVLMQLTIFYSRLHGRKHCIALVGLCKVRSIGWEFREVRPSNPAAMTAAQPILFSSISLGMSQAADFHGSLKDKECACSSRAFSWSRSLLALIFKISVAGLWEIPTANMMPQSKWQ